MQDHIDPDTFANDMARPLTPEPSRARRVLNRVRLEAITAVQVVVTLIGGLTVAGVANGVIDYWSV